MEAPMRLRVLCEKSLTEAVARSSMISFCPSMDLIALCTTNQQIQIYRLNGQQVYASNHRNSDLNVEGIRWKPSGHLLAIAWSDGSVKLIGSESTKIVHQFSTNDKSGITCIGWASNLTQNPTSLHKSTRQLETWGPLLFGNGLNSDAKEPLNLPRDLSQIDIETSLPKLSVLSSGGTSEDVFSSRASLDALFRPFDPNDTKAVDVMVVGTREGELHLSIYDTFVVGSFKSPMGNGEPLTTLMLHASNSKYSTQSLLFRSQERDPSLYFVPMDLRFVSASSKYLPLLASRSSALQNLLRYITETGRLMITEWESTRELPNKFLRNVDEDLKNDGNRDIVQALYHSVATGHTFPVVKEWLVDQLAERGHKRWDKAVTLGLQNLKQLVHENLLPALDRCSTILSRFSGIAKFRGSNDIQGFTAQQISLITDTIACLHLVASKILVQVVDELEHFAAFSAWIRYEIDRLASESSSTQDDEADKESTIDHGKVLHYIQSSLRTSLLSCYLGKISEETLQSGLKNIAQNPPIFDLLIKQIQKMELGQPYLIYLLQQKFLIEFLSIQASKVFAQIAESEKRNVLFGNTVEIGSLSEDNAIDMKVQSLGECTCRTLIATTDQKQPGLLQVIRINLSIEKGISNVESVESSMVQLGTGEIKDVKIFGDSILVLWSFDGSTQLLRIPSYSSTGVKLPGGGFKLIYTPYELGNSPPAINLGDDHVKRLFSVSVDTESGGSFVPGQTEIRCDETTNIEGRILLLDKSKMHYKVLKLVDNAVESHTDQDGDVAMPNSQTI